MNAPRVLSPVIGDFIADLRVDTEFTPGEQTVAQRTAYQGSGLLLMKDDQTYVRLESAVLVREERARFYTNFELRVDGRLQRFGTPVDFALDGQRSVWLRLERRGDHILGAVTQEPGQWNYLQAKSTPLPDELQLGVAAINASSKPLTAKFADLKVFTSRDDPPPAPPIVAEAVDPVMTAPTTVTSVKVEPVSCCRPCCSPPKSRCFFRRRRD
jgi:regulation of enolase protein 1 (concanavalin A-like superfamily)